MSEGLGNTYAGKVFKQSTPELSPTFPTQVDYEFIAQMEELGNHGQAKHGRGWRDLEYLKGRKCLRHLSEHLTAYYHDEPNDYFGTTEGQLVAVAFNAMMEWRRLQQLKPER